MNAMPTRRWSLRDRPALFWLLAAAGVAIAHRFVPDARWLMVHLVMLGALTHAIFVWSTHFTQALLKTPPGLDDRAAQSRRLVLLMVGVLTTVVSVPHGAQSGVGIGVLLVSAAVGWHAWALARRIRAALPGRFRVTVHYYLCAAACFPVGALLGVWLSTSPTEEWRGRILLAHTATMILGWVGLTVTGTLLTLWPTMLRTRIDSRAEQLAKQGLVPLVLSLAVLVGGALAGQRWVALLGLAGYLCAWLWTARALVKPARQAPPRRFSTWSSSAGICWFLISLVLIGVHVATAADWVRLASAYTLITPALVVGFALQLLFGALAHLVPVVIGGGARTVRAAQERFDSHAVARVVVVNAGLVLCLLPVPSWVRVACSVVVLVALLWFPVGMARAVAAARAAKEQSISRPMPGVGGTAALPPERGIFSPGQLVAAVSVLVLAVTAGVAVDPTASGLVATELGKGRSATSGLGGGISASGTGQTTKVRVVMKNMRFVPDSVQVTRGNRLEVELVNEDPGMTHDLVLASGPRSKRLDPGATQTVDLGVVTADSEGWCSIVGHRQMGMVFAVRVTGSAGVAAPGRPGSSPSQEAKGGHSGHGGVTSNGVRLGQEAGKDFRAVPAALPPLTAERHHRHTFTVEELELEVSPGVKQKRWTFNGAVPGPVLHGRVGDVFEITLVNKGSMGHSIDFHAGDIAPDGPMRTIAPGESLVYTFTAPRAGIWMYHCSTMPMATHIAAGMHGAVVIEPEGLPAVDRSYVLVQSEVYVDGDGTQTREVDAGAVHAEKPTAVVFNGVANQYGARPLPARVGERVRFWVLDAGPNRPSSFHVVGGQFDTVYFEGAYQLRHGHGPGTPGFGTTDARTGQPGPGGSQALGLAAAQGGFVEMVPTQAGNYAFVSHVMVDAERGAHGILRVTD